MKEVCDIPKNFNFGLVTKVSFILFIITIIINFIFGFYIYKLDIITTNFINIIVLIIWIIFILLYSKIVQSLYLKKIYSIDHHPCDVILKDFLMFFSEIICNCNIFEIKKLKKYIKNEYIKKKIKINSIEILIKDFINRLKKAGEIALYEKYDKEI